jgi:hypothetical protein
MTAAWIDDAPSVRISAPFLVEHLIELAQRRDIEIDNLHAGRSQK